MRRKQNHPLEQHEQPPCWPEVAMYRKRYPVLVARRPFGESHEESVNAMSRRGEPSKWFDIDVSWIEQARAKQSFGSAFGDGEARKVEFRQSFVFDSAIFWFNFATYTDWSSLLLQRFTDLASHLRWVL